MKQARHTKSDYFQSIKLSKGIFHTHTHTHTHDPSLYTSQSIHPSIPSHPPKTKVHLISAKSGEGLEGIVEDIIHHFHHKVARGEVDRRREDQNRYWFKKQAREEVWDMG